MSYPYEPQGWQAPVRQSSWEQPPPPSRSGASSTSQREENVAFAQQFAEIERAVDNLVKSGKFYPTGPRRDQAPMSMGVGRPFTDFNPRPHSGRHSFGSDFDPNRSHSASNLQNFYANQRYGRQNEGDQMAQAKRRMAAQRERELRNYHQEQQYNRTLLAEMSSNKSDRSMSPSTMSEEGRRELIARQHRALYGSENSAYLPQGLYGENDDARDPGANLQPNSAGAGRGNSPPSTDPFAMGVRSTQGETSNPTSGVSTDSSRAEKTASPSSGPVPPSFGNFENVSQSTGKVPTPPSGEEGHSRSMSKSTTAPVGGGMGPIGSRPTAQQAPNPGLNKRTTSPLPSSLNYNSFSGGDQSNAERTPSSNSNPNNQKEGPGSGSGSSMGAWGTGSGVWGSSKIGTTSVWG